LLNYCREWRGVASGESFLAWKDVSHLAKSRGIRVHGFVEGEPPSHDAHAATRALRLLAESDHVPHAVILLRDEDRDEPRRKGLEQARSSWGQRNVLVIGLARPTRECWVLAGYQPKDRRETELLERITAELGFNPTESPDRLTQRGTDQPRSPKRVLLLLTSGSWERQADCWQLTDLAILEARGRDTGLADYLAEVRTRLVPLLRSGPPPDQERSPRP
jgi:hypothetical protein